MNHTIISIGTQYDCPPERKRPCLDLLKREDYIRVGVPLYEAAIKGDWKAAKAILDKHPYLIRFAITENEETLLHIAASVENTKSVEQFVINLVNMMDKDDLELQNNSHDTALTLAAVVGNIRTAKIMVERNSQLIGIPNHEGVMPLYMAAVFGKSDMVRYLYGISDKMGGAYWTEHYRGWVLQKCVDAEIFDVAIKMVNDHPELTRNKVLITDVLVALARKTNAFEGTKPSVAFRIIKRISAMFHVNIGPGEKESESLQFLRIIWKIIATLDKSEIEDILRGPPGKAEMKNEEEECEALPKSENEKENETKTCYPYRVLFLATKMGNTRFIIEFIRLYPDLIWKTDDKRRTIFHLAIKHRQAKIYNLLHEIGVMKEIIPSMTDINGNNMLHMVAKSAKQNQFQNVSGAALHMQRELLWFKEVEQIIPPQYRQQKNREGETPQELFAKKHVALVTKGEGWMKNYMLVATLIATIVFAAAFTLPGGYNENTGIPYFRNQPSLIIFVISDAISLISSSTSVLIFLSILTSSYAELDILESLPERLMFGVATLFLSIVTMMVAFSASFFVLYNKKLQWVPITATCLAGMPIILFAKMQFHLSADIFYSAYRSKSLFKPSKRVLYI